ncbi:UNVERIFIED_CONTAM: putative late blight resistance proteinR1A-4 [Sesamum radiatum]|uniref:Late blight resistance proteinR1A-4 n=1 Tax=Sesamum radiatum TaxID=300843 RepID=A0AAW2PKB7_SESRA
MDDVWTIEDWEKLQTALPKSNTMGKVLITSRDAKVGHHANKNRFPYYLDFLTRDESWMLLQFKVFGKLECPHELEILGKVIADQCNGLPLAIVVIGGVLAKTFSAPNDMVANINAWTKVSNSVTTYFKDPQGQMEKIIALSYDKLPYHLRACFLYFECSLKTLRSQLGN